MTSDTTDHGSAPKPARLITPPPPAAADTLPARINAATRQVHASLNKLVISRLLYGLPPHTNLPILYLYGVDAFAQLYFAFEDAWQDLICENIAVPSSVPQATNPASESSPELLHEHALRSLLSTLVPPQLWRTDRLERDISYLRRLTTAEGSPLSPSDDLLKELLDHIRQAVEHKPHVLLAYSWVLYMAIFSGGRWIRAQLQSAGPDFWGHERREVRDRGPVQDDGMKMFYFDGAEDGEDTKRLFKEKFATADPLLSETEKIEVVWEAGWIFDACTKLVHRLDEKLATPVAEDGEPNPSGEATRTFGTAKTRDARAALPKSRSPDVVPGALRPYHLPQGSQDPGLLPGRRVTAGLESYTTVVAIVLGVAGWYLLYTYGLLGRGILSDWTTFGDIK